MDDYPIVVPLTELWNRLVSKIYIISLKECEDRRNKIEKELERVGIKQYSFKIVEKDQEDTKRGCFLSHQSAIRDGFEMGFERILILEDDAYFINSLNVLRTSLQEVVSWIERNRYNDDYLDIFFLGHLPILPLRPIDKNSRIVKSDGSRYTHSYIMTRVGMEKLLKTEYGGKHYDYYTGQFPNNYALYPMISYQDDVASVNDYHKLYKLFSGVRNKISCRRLCRVAEIACYFKGVRLMGDVFGFFSFKNFNLLEKIRSFKKNEDKNEKDGEYWDI